INSRVTFTQDNDVSSAVINAVKDHDINLIIIGARGRTAVASLVLGSVTEKLIRNSYMPVLAVKKKGENLGLLQAMFHI
ncbi:MAG: universal stress protein, partial [Planctomycetota bacterium]